MRAIRNLANLAVKTPKHGTHPVRNNRTFELKIITRRNHSILACNTNERGDELGGRLRLCGVCVVPPDTGSESMMIHGKQWVEAGQSESMILAESDEDLHRVSDNCDKN